MSTSLPKGAPIATLAWAIAGGALCAAMIPLEPNLLEEGLLLHVAQRMVRGEQLFRDIASFTGPLPFEALALLFRIFGEEIAVARSAVAVLCGLSVAAVYDLARRAEAGALAHAAAAVVASAPILLFPLFSLYFYTTLSVFLCILATCAALRGIRSVGWAFTAGLLIAAVALSKQTIGVLLAIGLLAGVAGCAPPGRRLRSTAAIAGGGALAAALTLGSAALRGDLTVLVRSLVFMPLSFTDTFSFSFINLWPPGQFSAEIAPNKLKYMPSLYSISRNLLSEVRWPVVLLTQALYALPFAAIAATLGARLRRPLPAACWIHLAALVALTSNLFPRTDWGHITFVIPAALVQVLLLFPRGRAALAPAPTRTFATLAVVAILATGDALAARHLYAMSQAPRLGPRVPLRPVTRMQTGDDLPRVVRFLRKRVEPGEPIFVPRSEPLLYFATDTTNPTPYSGVLPGMRAEQERAILKGLERVRFVAMSEIDQPLYTYYRDELPAVQAYLERYFRIPAPFLGVRNKSWIVVLERSGDRGETAVDLFEALPDAKAWMRDRSGRIQPAPSDLPVLRSRHNRRPMPFAIGPEGGGVDFEVSLPVGARFQGDVGFRKLSGLSARYTHQDGGRMAVSIRRSGEAGAFEQVGAVRVPHQVGTSHGWHPVEIDLARYAGERVTLRLEFDPETPVEAGALAWWGSPRIAFPPPDTVEGGRTP